MILLGRDRTEILLWRSDVGLALPTVEILRWERVAESLTSIVKRGLGCDAICLFTPNRSREDSTSNLSRYEVMECWRDGGSTGGTTWKAINSLNPRRFQHAEEFKTIEQCLHQLEGYECDPSCPFARSRWISELRGWAAETIRPLGLELTDSLRQYNASPTFSLIRLETNGPAVWFKAVGEPSLREFPITLKLAELFPKFMPEILGTKPEWNGWLSRQVQGGNLGQTDDLAPWEQAAANLARLQIESISECKSLLLLGAHDLRSNALLSALDPFFDVISRLMDEQPKTPPEPLSRGELTLLRVPVNDVLTTMDNLRVPTTLGHLDLNPWNIMISAHGSFFLDWAEAYVGNPFFSCEYLLEHFRRAWHDSGAKFVSQVVNAYMTCWQRRLTNGCVKKAMALAPLAAIYAYAVGTHPWKDKGMPHDPRIAGYFRSLARRMNQEAIQVERIECVS